MIRVTGLNQNRHHKQASLVSQNKRVERPTERARALSLQHSKLAIQSAQGGFLILLCALHFLLSLQRRLIH